MLISTDGRLSTVAATRASKRRRSTTPFTGAQPIGAIHPARLSSGSIVWPRHISR
jgi:hypothetical protein